MMDIYTRIVGRLCDLFFCLFGGFLFSYLFFFYFFFEIMYNQGFMIPLTMNEYPS